MTDAFDERYLSEADTRFSSLAGQLPLTTVEGLAREAVRSLSRNALVPDDPDHPAPRNIEALARALIATDPSESTDMMRHLQQRGVTLDVLYFTYLAGAAQRLGAMWDADQVNFMQVTIGTGRIYAIVRRLRRALPTPPALHTETVTIAAVSGEDHALGVEMAVEYFREKGWNARLLVGLDHDAILRDLADQPCEVLGLSASATDAALESLSRLVVAARLAHPHMTVMVGGGAAQAPGDLLTLLAPDHVFTSVTDALAVLGRGAQ